MNVKNLAGLVGSPCFIPFSMAHAAVSPKEVVTEYHEPACMRFINSMSASGTPYASRVRYTAFIFVDVKAVLKSNCTTTGCFDCLLGDCLDGPSSGGSDDLCENGLEACGRECSNDLYRG